MSLDGTAMALHRPYVSRGISQSASDDAHALKKALENVKTIVENEEEHTLLNNDFIKAQLDDISTPNAVGAFFELDKDAQELALSEIQKFTSYRPIQRFSKYIQAIPFYSPFVSSLECQSIRNDLLCSRHAALTASGDYKEARNLRWMLDHGDKMKTEERFFATHALYTFLSSKTISTVKDRTYGSTQRSYECTMPPVELLLKPEMLGFHTL